jgi:class 3 adenylate cyclase
VAVGLNYAPLFVGRIGPNNDYTGFSSGMNNTARLQGVAKGGQILAMSQMAEILARAAGFQLGASGSMPVKNVKDPLTYQEVIGLA